MIDNLDIWNGGHGFVLNLIQSLFGSSWVTSFGVEAVSNVNATLITKLGLWANYGAMVLLTVIIAVYLANLFRITENPSEIIKEKWMLMVKATIIFILIAPVYDGSVSLIQRVGVQKMAVAGNNLGNAVFSYAIDEALSPPQNDVQASQIVKYFNDIVQMQSCAMWVAEKDHTNHLFADNLPPAFTTFMTKSIAFDGKFFGGTHSQLYVSSQTPDPFVAGMEFKKNYSGNVAEIYMGIGLNAKTNPSCGVLVLPSYLSNNKSNNLFVNEIFPPVAKALQEMDMKAYNRLLELSRIYYEITYATEKQIVSTGDEVEGDKEGLNNLEKYNTFIREKFPKIVERYMVDFNKAKKISETKTQEILHNDSLITQIKEAGWGLGVVWWRLVSEYELRFADLMNSAVNGASPMQPPTCGWAYRGACLEEKTGIVPYQVNKKSLTADMVSSIVSNEALNRPVANGGLGKAGIESIQKLSLQNAGSIKASMDAQSSLIMKAIITDDIQKNYLNTFEGVDYNKASGNFEGGQLVSIFETSALVGANLMGIAEYALTAQLSGAFIKTTAITSGWLGALFAGFGAVLESMSSLVVTLIIPPASILSYGLPMLPVVIWAGLVLSYFFMLIEAFFAIPFGTALWIVTDKLLVSTRVLQTVNMLLAILFRPMLMVLGLISVYAVAPISNAIWNTVFFWGMGTNGSEGILASIALVYLYTYGLIKMSTMTIELGLALPDKILAWLDSGFGGGGFGGAMNSADWGSVMDKSAEGSGKVGSGIGNAGSAGIAQVKQTRNEQSKKKQNDINQNGADIKNGEQRVNDTAKDEEALSNDYTATQDKYDNDLKGEDGNVAGGHKHEDGSRAGVGEVEVAEDKATADKSQKAVSEAQNKLNKAEKNGGDTGLLKNDLAEKEKVANKDLARLKESKETLNKHKASRDNLIQSRRAKYLNKEQAGDNHRRANANLSKQYDRREQLTGNKRTTAETNNTDYQKNFTKARENREKQANSKDKKGK